MAALNPLSVGEDLICNFGATLWVTLKMLGASRCPSREAVPMVGGQRWDPGELPLRLIPCWYSLAQWCVIYRENSESIHELRIHSCMRQKMPFGGMFLCSWPPPRKGNPEAPGEGSEGPATFTPLVAERLPFSPTKGWIHHSARYDQKHLNIFAEDYACVLVGKFLKTRSSQILNLIPEIAQFLPALFSAVGWDPHLV